MEFILLFICLFACTIGAISGIGGGIIIKPIIERLDIMNISTLNFLSGVTVLAMSSFSLFQSKNKNTKNKFNISIFLSLGGIIGGIIGKQLFNIIAINSEDNKIGILQAILLFSINIFILIFMFIKNKLKTKNIKNKFATVLLGILLGVISSFLGIGGGPLNIAVISYFYSFSPIDTAYASLVIVFFSQLSSLLFTFYTGLPKYENSYLIFMCLGGILGALIGRNISKKIDNDKTEKFFIIVLICLIILNIFNIIKYIRL